MKKVIIMLYRFFVPKKIRKCISEFIYNYPRYKLKKKIIAYLKKQNDYNEIINQIVKFLKSNPLTMYPYNFTKKYDMKSIEVYYDNIHECRFVFHENKKLYFRKDWGEDIVKCAYNNLLIEQDVESPHCYVNCGGRGAIGVFNGDVVLDAGAAEGIFALSVVERAGKIYLFECEQLWLEALSLTFEPWKDKVEIVNKFVSDKSDHNSISLDDFFAGKQIDFIKADIEGAEIKMLQGAKRILSESKKLAIAICTYHNQNDADEISCILTSLNFNIEFSKNYVITEWLSEPHPPYLRKGIIRAKKHLSERNEFLEA